MAPQPLEPPPSSPSAPGLFPESASPSAASRPRFTIDSSRFVRLVRSARHQRALISIGPQLAANLIITCCGLGLLLLWRRSGGRDILLCAALLLLYAPVGISSDLESYGVLHIPWMIYVLSYSLIQIAQMDCNIEFAWTIHAYRNRLFLHLGQAALVLFNVPSLSASWP